MSSYGAEPEKVSKKGEDVRKGLDVGSMSADFTFNSDANHTVDVTVTVTGSGTDVTNFALYGASNDTSPSTAANGADRLTGTNSSSATRPASLSGSGTWTAGEDYTIEMTYDFTRTVNGVSTTSTVTWYYTVPGTSISTQSSSYSFNSQSMTKR